MNVILTHKKFLLSGLSIAVIAALFTFIVCNIASVNITKANAEFEGREQTAINVSTVEEASKIAGFRVVAPITDFKDNVLEYKIEVIQLRIASNGPNSRPVSQNWTLTDGSWIRLVQLPGLDMPEMGTSFNIDSIEGRRVFLEGDSDMPSRVGFYWRNGDVGYCLCGTITDSIDEATLITMVNSVYSISN
jgi:hypothetical protein